MGRFLRPNRLIDYRSEGTPTPKWMKPDLVKESPDKENNFAGGKNVQKLKHQDNKDGNSKIRKSGGVLQDISIKVLPKIASSNVQPQQGLKRSANSVIEEKSKSATIPAADNDSKLKQNASRKKAKLTESGIQAQETGITVSPEHTKSEMGKPSDTKGNNFTEKAPDVSLGHKGEKVTSQVTNVSLLKKVKSQNVSNATRTTRNSRQKNTDHNSSKLGQDSQPAVSHEVAAVADPTVELNSTRSRMSSRGRKSVPLETVSKDIISTGVLQAAAGRASRMSAVPIATANAAKEENVQQTAGMRGRTRSAGVISETKNTNVLPQKSHNRSLKGHTTKQQASLKPASDSEVKAQAVNAQSGGPQVLAMPTAEKRAETSSAKPVDNGDPNATIRLLLSKAPVSKAEDWPACDSHLTQIDPSSRSVPVEAFLELQTQYLQIQNLYGALKKQRIMDIEALMKEQEEYVDEVNRTAAALTEHWRKEAENQSKLVEAAGYNVSASVIEELQEEKLSLQKHVEEKAMHAATLEATITELKREVNRLEQLHVIAEAHRRSRSFVDRALQATPECQNAEVQCNFYSVPEAFATMCTQFPSPVPPSPGIGFQFPSPMPPSPGIGFQFPTPLPTLQLGSISTQTSNAAKDAVDAINTNALSPKPSSLVLRLTPLPASAPSVRDSASGSSPEEGPKIPCQVLAQCEGESLQAACQPQSPLTPAPGCDNESEDGSPIEGLCTGPTDQGTCSPNPPAAPSAVCEVATSPSYPELSMQSPDSVPVADHASKDANHEQEEEGFTFAAPTNSGDMQPALSSKVIDGSGVVPSNSADAQPVLSVNAIGGGSVAVPLQSSASMPDSPSVKQSESHPVAAPAPAAKEPAPKVIRPSLPAHPASRRRPLDGTGVVFLHAPKAAKPPKPLYESPQFKQFLQRLSTPEHLKPELQATATSPVQFAANKGHQGLAPELSKETSIQARELGPPIAETKPMEIDCSVQLQICVDPEPASCLPSVSHGSCGSGVQPGVMDVVPVSPEPQDPFAQERELSGAPLAAEVVLDIMDATGPQEVPLQESTPLPTQAVRLEAQEKDTFPSPDHDGVRRLVFSTPGLTPGLAKYREGMVLLCGFHFRHQDGDPHTWIYTHPSTGFRFCLGPYEGDLDDSEEEVANGADASVEQAVEELKYTVLSMGSVKTFTKYKHLEEEITFEIRQKDKFLQQLQVALKNAELV